MAKTLAEVRVMLADTFRAGTARGAAGELAVYSTMVDNPSLPAVIIEPTDANFAVSMRAGTDVYDFNVYVMCSRAETETGQIELDDFVSGHGPNSLREALENDPNLGDVDENTTAFAHGFVGYGGSFDTAKVQLVGAVMKVRVNTEGR